MSEGKQFGLLVETSECYSIVAGQCVCVLVNSAFLEKGFSKMGHMFWARCSRHLMSKSRSCFFNVVIRTFYNVVNIIMKTIKLCNVI